MSKIDDLPIEYEDASELGFYVPEIEVICPLCGCLEYRWLGWLGGKLWTCCRYCDWQYPVTR
jgi:hypothetical protein